MSRERVRENCVWPSLALAAGSYLFCAVVVEIGIAQHEPTTLPALDDGALLGQVAHLLEAAGATQL